jgi:hypothetical protein
MGKWGTDGDLRPFKGCHGRGKKEGGQLSSAPRGERKWGRAPVGNRERCGWHAAWPFKTRDGELLTGGATRHSSGRVVKCV